MNSMLKSGLRALAAGALALTLIHLSSCAEKPVDLGPRASNPMTSRLKGKECMIWDDAQGVPHVRAGDPIESMACFGYVQARDRAWQMDYLRRIAQGRQAEVFGWEAIRTDFLMRVLELEKRAAHLFTQLAPEQQNLLWAYSYGVNRAFQDLLGGTDRAGQESSLAVYEFAELQYQPEPWHPSHSLAILLLQSFDQTRKTFESELEETTWLGQHGENAENLFSTEDLPWHTAILKEGEYEARAEIPQPVPASGTEPDSAGRLPPGSVDARGAVNEIHRIREALAALPDLTGKAGGSNNWVIAPGRSESGKAWLANDPHLGLKYPPFWHWTHLADSAGLDAIGAAVPGVPVIVSGTNRGVAWGLTNSYADVADLNLVQEDGLESAETFRPTIWFRWWKLRLPFFLKTFRRTADGAPVLPLDAPEGQAIVLRWTGFNLRSDDIEGLFNVMRARDVRSMDESLSRVGVPSWNFVFADTQGKIGYRTVGQIPRRESSSPFGIGGGIGGGSALGSPWSAKPLDSDEMPRLLNPERGYIATANNAQWKSNARHSLGRAHTSSFRAFRIEELISAREKHSLESNRAIQCDVQAVDARFILPELVRTVAEREETSPHLDVREKAVLVRLAEWDYEASLSCEPCAVYRLWVDRLMEATSLNEAGLYRKLVGGDEEIVGPAELAFVEALDSLGVNERGELLPWGQLHKNRFPHLAKTAGSQGEGVPTPGDEHSVNPGTMDHGFNGEIFEHTSGASHRLIVELTTPPTVHAQLSGPNPDVPHLPRVSPDSPWIQWAQCRYERRVFPLDWDEVEGEKLSL